MEQTFRKRLLLGHVSIVLVIVLSAATALVALRSTIHQAERRSQVERRIARIEQLRAEARELGRSARRFLLTGDFKEQQRVLAIQSEMDRERKLVATREHALDYGLDKYVGTVIDSLSSDHAEPSMALTRFEDDLIRVRGPLSVAFDAIVARERAALDASRLSQRVAISAQWALMIAAALGVVLTIGSTILVSVLLRRYAVRARGAEAVADRATTHRKELLAASDDLRGPLAQIMTQTAELRTRERSENDLLKLQSIASSASRVDHLLHRLLDISGVQMGTVSLRREPCDAATLIDQAIREHRDAAHERGVRLRFETRLSLTVCVDRDRIADALASLVGFAITCARSGAEIELIAAPSQDGVRFAVVDVGVTVPTPNVFRPAAVASPDDLALHLSQRVVEAHGGRMGIEAAAAGRTYWFTLPTEPRMLR